MIVTDIKDAGSTLYYKLTLFAFSSDELRVTLDEKDSKYSTQYLDKLDFIMVHEYFFSAERI